MMNTMSNGLAEVKAHLQDPIRLLRWEDLRASRAAFGVGVAIFVLTCLVDFSLLGWAAFFVQAVMLGVPVLRVFGYCRALPPAIPQRIEHALFSAISPTAKLLHHVTYLLSWENTLHSLTAFISLATAAMITSFLSDATCLFLIWCALFAAHPLQERWKAHQSQSHEKVS